ncbi:Hypothetical protein SCF082_LOCUS14795 [Durusdinium trenchii]|uniref:Ubiquitin-like domain-containing protein n=1 Tax=Durusdinium trenchii TaxID=1381693 RepID=A0ABP0K1C4_9DINO
MAPRPLDETVPFRGPPVGHCLEEEEEASDTCCDAEESQQLDDDEPVALQVLRGHRQVLETVVDSTTTVEQLKVQVEQTTGIPGERQIIALKGKPLCNSLALRSSLNRLVSTVTVREADQSWVKTLEDLQNSEALKAEASIVGTEAQCEAALKDAKVMMEELRQTAAETISQFKQATAALVTSASDLEEAAERLQRNRAVIFEVVPRGSKGARRAAEDLMQCRSSLLAATQANGKVLAARSSCVSSVHNSCTTQLLMTRASIRHASECLSRRIELLHMQRLGSLLSNADVQLKLQRCQDDLICLREVGLERLSQDLMAARRNYKVAMRSNLLAIKRASEFLQQDERVVLTWALNHVSKGRASDRDFMLAVVQCNGEALEEAPPELQQDREAKA